MAATTPSKPLLWSGIGVAAVGVAALLVVAFTDLGKADQIASVAGFVLAVVGLGLSLWAQFGRSGGAVEATGTRSVAAGGNIGVVVTGDGAGTPPAPPGMPSGGTPPPAPSPPPVSVPSPPAGTSGACRRATRERGRIGVGERSVAVGGDIGWVHTGDRVTVLPPEATGPVRCPDGLVNVPRKSAHFVGRTDELDALEAAEEPVVVCGLGGVGKSSLVAHWARRQAPHRNPVWWITAESRADVDAGLAGLAAAMQPELIDTLPQEALRERALQWLSAHEGWLLVLDNVTDPEDVAGLLARTGRGRVVLTSRTTDAWYGIGRVLTLPVLAAGEAVELFTRVATHAGPRDTIGADRLCESLGQLPLAVEIAAAYCGRTATPPVAYLAELGRSGGPGNAEEAVARALRVTLDRLDESDPYAGGVLRLLAWFAPDRIPVPLLPTAPGTREALGQLAAHSMVTLHEDGSVSVHRLVQAVVRRPDPEDPHREPGRIEQARLTAETALGHAVPLHSEEPVPWETWRGLMSHVEAYLRHTDPPQDGESLLGTLAAAGGYLDLHGLHESAVGMYERAVAGAERLLGPDDLFTFTLRGALVHSLGWAGRPETGERAAELLRSLTEALGTDHRFTFLARRTLAHAHRQAGRFDEAVALQEAVLVDMTRALGATDQDTLLASDELASLYKDAHRISDALSVCAHAVSELRLSLGKDHPDTLRARINLAGLYAGAGKRRRSRAELRALLPVCRSVFGENHPHTLSVATALGIAPE
ncbi:tetratricopeptide repeat protein [Streptomyces diastatochromogenes]|nr:tetratricopeptide repeat protein [Streptomyces diastatochromogenes]